MSSLRCNLHLETAFGSVSHELILDMLSHCKLYHNRSSHIFNLYSKLTAYVRKKKWSTSRVSIGRGVSLPSHILCFLQSHYPPGPIPKILWNSPEDIYIYSNLQVTLKINSYIYSYWDEQNLDEPMAWIIPGQSHIH